MKEQKTKDMLYSLHSYECKQHCPEDLYSVWFKLKAIKPSHVRHHIPGKGSNEQRGYVCDAQYTFHV